MSKSNLGTQLKTLVQGAPLRAADEEKRLNVVLDAGLHQAVKRYAVDRKVPVSAIVRVLLARLLADPEGDLDAAVRAAAGEDR